MVKFLWPFGSRINGVPLYKTAFLLNDHNKRQQSYLLSAGKQCEAGFSHVYNFCCSRRSYKLLSTENNPYLISRVRGPYGKLWTEFFPSFYGPSAERAGHENKEGKNEDP